jgi:O-methyltransferase involved in polyketide biosynthesis
MDYGLPRASLSLLEQMAFDSMASRVAASGEPFQLFFTPDEIHARIASMGWSVIEDLDRDGMNKRYFADPQGSLTLLGRGGHLLAARLVSSPR